ncbi:MAG TPA: AI-2E family transporter [Rhizomicrobium sp.]|nr:AI-2E family transporter [Rhizomicrobium sp.]
MKIDERRLAHWLLSGAVLLVLLIYGRPLFVPLVFALLMWAVLNALTEFLCRLRFPAWLAWCTAFVLIGGALYFAAVVLTNEAAAVIDRSPYYIAKLEHLWAKRFPYAHYFPSFDLQSALKDANVANVLGQTAATIGNSIVELVLVAIYVGFLLAEQQYLPAKLAKLQDGAAEAEGRKIIHQMAVQIRSYLGVCTFLSVVMALACYVVLVALGVDFAGFWALLMFLLTYIPTVGALGVVLPALMALAQFESLRPVLIIVIVLGLLHFVLTNIVETIMLGRSLNLSPFAIIISLTFWGLIWGIGGLFLAVPLTGALAIGCQHIEGLEWVAEAIAGPPPRARRHRIRGTDANQRRNAM